MSAPHIRLIDSHIHLWPLETSNEDGHAWMTPGNSLAKPHLLEHYFRASEQTDVENPNVEVEGVVYVETDVRYEDPSSGGDLETWAQGPLDEIKFLATIVDGKYGQLASDKLLGVVPWAPMDHDLSTFKEYLGAAHSRLSSKTWRRIKGFRYLLQFVKDPGAFEQLVLGPNFIENLKELGRRQFSFDIGVDQRSGGTFQLELVVQAMQKAHEDVPKDERVTFIVNHLCKPAFNGGKVAFDAWCKAIKSTSEVDNTYMKLSGAFSELPDDVGTDPHEISKYMEPWLKHVLECFGPRRIMFGSDWPVCNVRGPKGEDSWVAWKDVVHAALTSPVYGLSETDQRTIWRDTAYAAYGLGTNI